MKNNVLFSVNEHDKDGDVSDTGIFLHFGETRVKVADNVKDLEEFIERLQGMLPEITENYVGQI